MRKNGAMTGIKGLLAVVLAVILGLPGISWGQGTQSQTHRGDSPHQADKSYFTDQQKKGQIRNKGQKPQTQPKGRRQKAGPATQSQPPTKLMRGGPASPLGPAGQ